MGIKFVAAQTISVLLMCGTAAAQVPHQFQAGTPAKASEVNENFDALNTAITGLQSSVSSLQIPTSFVLVDSTGVEIGPVLDISWDGSSTGGQKLYVQFVVSGTTGSSRVFAEFDKSGFTAGFALYYESSNCTGVGHIRWNPDNFSALNEPNTVEPLSGRVYVLSGPQTIPFTAMSYARVTSLQPDGTPNVSCNGGSAPATDEFYPTDGFIEFYQLFPPPYDLITKP